MVSTDAPGYLLQASLSAGERKLLPASRSCSLIFCLARLVVVQPAVESLHLCNLVAQVHLQDPQPEGSCASEGLPRLDFGSSGRTLDPSGHCSEAAGLHHAGLICILAGLSASSRREAADGGAAIHPQGQHSSQAQHRSRPDSIHTPHTQKEKQLFTAFRPSQNLDFSTLWAGFQDNFL